MTAARRPMLVGALAAAVTALVASAAVAVGAGNGGAIPGSIGLLSGSSPAAPSLPGTVVNVSLADMSGRPSPTRRLSNPANPHYGRP